MKLYTKEGKNKFLSENEFVGNCSCDLDPVMKDGMQTYNLYTNTLYKNKKTGRGSIVHKFDDKEWDITENCCSIN